MQELIDLLSKLHPDIDFRNESGLITDGILTSLDVVTIVMEINDKLDISIPPEEIIPENFDSVTALWSMLERLDDI